MGQIDIKELCDRWCSWTHVKPGDKVTILVNDIPVIESLVYRAGVMGLLSEPFLSVMAEEFDRQRALNEDRKA